MPPTTSRTPAPTAMAWKGPGLPHETIAVPHIDLGAGDALVEIEYATICGSDIHTVSGHRSAAPPLVLGHEQVGRVVAATPEAVLHDGTPLAPGDRVVWTVTVSCGRCATCARGLGQKCEAILKYGHERIVRGWELNGGFATHVHVKAGSGITRVPEEVPAAILAPVSCATATAAAALRAAAGQHPLAGTTVLVSGAGMVGLSITAMAVTAGANVVVLDPAAERRAMALKFGAVLALDPLALDPLAPLPAAPEASATGRTDLGGALAAAHLPAPLACFEASGAPAAVGTAIDALGIGGIAVLVGSVSPGPAVGIDPEAIVRGLKTITGVHNYAAEDLETAVAFISATWDTMPFAELVGPRYFLHELDAALDAARTGADVRVGIQPGGTAG